MSVTSTARETIGVVMAAGKGTRMRSRLPKVLHPVAGRPMLHWVLDALDEAGCARLVVIVGHGGVGKTYLMNRLIKDETPETVSTEGIEIEKWYLATDVAKKFHINFGDFGGQDIYHAKHQCFLSSRSLSPLFW